MAGPLARFVTISDTGVSGPYNLDASISPFNVAIQVYVPGGVTTAYSVEYTLDELNLPTGLENTDARWVEDPEFPTGSAATITSNYIAPISAVRVNVASIAGGSIELKIRQGFSIN